jgi:hypothetical protein
MQPPHAIGPIELFMTEDHARIDRTLQAASLADGSIDPTTYARFRHDLLRHIAMEEKVLLPYARGRATRARGAVADRSRTHRKAARALASR